MRDLKPSEIDAVSGGYFSRWSFFSSFGANRDFDIGSCGGWGSLLEWKPDRDLISYDDSGNRFYDSWHGRGIVHPDGSKTFEDGYSTFSAFGLADSMADEALRGAIAGAVVGGSIGDGPNGPNWPGALSGAFFGYLGGALAGGIGYFLDGGNGQPD